MKVGTLTITDGNGSLFETGTNHDLYVTERGAFVHDEELGPEVIHTVADLEADGIDFAIYLTENISKRAAHASELALLALAAGENVRFAQNYWVLCTGNRLASRNRDEFTQMCQTYITIEARRQLQEEAQCR